MNDEPRPDETPIPFLPPPPAPPVNSVTTIDWRAWARRLLVCNPFFLCSAALLLFGVNRLSIDPDFLGEDRANLLFNYGALQLYGFLVVGTALILARRKIWYDSSLLVVVEHGLALVPFMLISHGALIQRGLGATLASLALVFAALRARAIRQWFPQFNLPPRALLLGAVVLLVNAALAMFYPPAVVKSTDDWATPNLWLWYVVLPLLVGGANILPKPTRYGGSNPERHWLPLFIYALWIGGAGTHVWCLAHISDFPFQTHWLGPAAIVAAWTMYRRITDCLPEQSPRWQGVMLGLACAAPLLSIGHAELFESLVFVNAMGFAFLFLRGVGAARTCARELFVLCLPLAVAGLPPEIGRIFVPNFLRPQGPLIATALLVCIYALRWFRVPLSLSGALGTTVLMMYLRPTAPAHAFVQTAVLFLLTHSLAWRKDAVGATFFRTVAALVWFLDAAWWVHIARWPTDVSVTAAALILLSAWLAIWRVSKERPDAVVPIAAASVSLCAPTDWLLRNGSAGLVALAASGALFAIGFVVAWTRHRWEVVHTRK